MLLTEEQAREKACCQGATRPKENGACIATDCMAWRFARPEVRKNWSSKPEVLPPVPNDNWEPYGDVYEVTDTIPKAQQSAGEKQFERQFIRRCGYCGLAGKAET